MSLVQATSNDVELRAGEPFLLHQFFERTARQWPDRIAVDVPPSNGSRQRRLITYAELERQSNSLAGSLRPLVDKESVVAILLPRHTEHLCISQLAVLKAGAAYTCIDSAFPDDQVRDILADSEAVALLTDEAGAARASRFSFAAGRVFEVAGLIAENENSIAEPPPWLAATSLAYIIYTSGTTGRPKGVMIEHASIANLVGSDLEEFCLSPNDRVGQSSSASYDSSIEEIWLAFAAGATVVVMDDETTRLGPDLVPWLRRERITVFCPPPTMLRTTGCDDPETALPDLSLLYVGGEALPPDVADRWARGRRLVNGYGPTECSVTSIRETIREGEPVTIGRPVRGLQAWVLNDSLDEVPDGQQGELCLGGAGLARGYRNRPDLTAEKFPEHPRLGRIYRTGDLAHRDPEGRIFYHGRIDSQIKLRGYRIELEAIERRLAECAGVRDAACRVQGNGAHQTLVAFVVPEDGRDAPSFDELKAALRKSLPSYMVPSRFGVLSDLPTTVGGKHRNDLPFLEAQRRNGHHSGVAPRNGLETKVAAAFVEVLRLPDGISVYDDFFNDLGGDSLNAAELISLLRDDPTTASIAVRDLYETRTIAGLAIRAGSGTEIETVVAEEFSRSTGKPVLATGIQIVWILTGLVLASSVVSFAALELVPFLIRSMGLIPFLLLAPTLLSATLAIYAPAALLLAVAAKKILIGRYRPLRAPVWGSFYVRNWMVQQAVRIVPWGLMHGTVFQLAALRALGARIGRRVHIHRGVSLLQGGWDLLDIGDDVTISQDASIRLVDLDDGHVVVGAVTLGDESTLDIRAGVGGNSCLEAGAYLAALSSLPEGSRIPRGERWDGVPARPAGQSPPRPFLPEPARAVSPFLHGAALILTRAAVGAVLLLSLQLPAIAFAVLYGVGTEEALSWLSSPSLDPSLLLGAMMVVILSAPLRLALQIVLVRTLGRVPAGVISRWSLPYIGVWVSTRIVQSAGHRLSGTLFWPVWLRLAGMKVGRGCEISTIIDVIPALLEIGNRSFLADGIYLGGPRVHRGTVTLASTRLGENTFLGNHVVIAAGQQLADDSLLGVCTVADDSVVRAGTAWFGHPPFELPRREIVECDRRLTHDPSLLRYWNRVFWEILRFGLPVVHVLVLPVWYALLAASAKSYTRPVLLFVTAPLLSLGTLAFFCVLVLALKWALLGRVQPGVHPLWSCWCSRWDFLYVAWAVFASGALSLLEGTLLLSWYLRAMGARIGRGVVLGGGFAQVVDPDMLCFEDGATVSCQFQAHTFEDRVLKIDRVIIRRRATVKSAAVLLYGADIGERTHVAAHSVVMKRESLLAGRSYSGVPTRPIQSKNAAISQRPEWKNEAVAPVHAEISGVA